MVTELKRRRDYIPKILKTWVPTKSGNQVRIAENDLRILQMVADGIPTKRIAEKEFSTISRIDNIRFRVVRLLEVSNCCEAVAFAIRKGIIK